MTTTTSFHPFSTITTTSTTASNTATLYTTSTPVISAIGNAPPVSGSIRPRPRLPLRLPYILAFSFLVLNISSFFLFTFLG